MGRLVLAAGCGTQINPSRPPFTIAGDGKQVRDLLFVEDAVRCYWRRPKTSSAPRAGV
jgi:nucleoside-diphosphate-sugar epimerase